MTLRRPVIVVAILLLAGSGLGAQRRMLPQGAAVLGQVVDAHTGRGLERVIVQIESADLRRQLVTDNKGRFLFTGLPGGEYQVKASRNGYLNGAFGQRRAAGDSSTISLVYGQWMNNVDVSLWRPAVVTGFVTDEAGSPIAGVAVRGYRHDRRAGHAALREAAQAVTDDTGAYRLGGLIPGEHMVGISMQDDEVFAPMYFPAADLVVGASIVTAESGRDIAGINFTVRPAEPREVTGRVDPASVPEGKMSAVRLVLARPLDPFVAESSLHRTVSAAVPDDEGLFTFRNVPPGDFVIEATLIEDRPEADPAASRPLTAPAIRWARHPISVGGPPEEGITVTLRPGINIQGTTRVTSVNSRNVAAPPALSVSFEPLFEVRGVQALFAPATPDGAFESGAALVPGRYLVRVSGVPPGWRLRAVTAGGIDVSDEGLELLSGYAPPDLTVELTDQLTVITGTVRGVGPLTDAGSTVLLFPQGSGRMAARRYQSARTSNDGTFTFRNVPAGSYLIAAVDEADAGGWLAPERLETLASRATRVVIREGEAKVIELRRVRAR